jgi:hypothetical protein
VDDIRVLHNPTQPETAEGQLYEEDWKVELAACEGGSPEERALNHLINTGRLEPMNGTYVAYAETVLRLLANQGVWHLNVWVPIGELQFDYEDIKYAICNPVDDDIREPEPGNWLMGWLDDLMAFKVPGLIMQVEKRTGAQLLAEEEAEDSEG